MLSCVFLFVQSLLCFQNVFFFCLAVFSSPANVFPISLFYLVTPGSLHGPVVSWYFVKIVSSLCIIRTFQECFHCNFSFYSSSVIIIIIIIIMRNMCSFPLLVVLTFTSLTQSFKPFSVPDSISMTHRDITERAILQKTAEVCRYLAAAEKRDFSLSVRQHLCMQVSQLDAIHLEVQNCFENVLTSSIGLWNQSVMVWILQTRLMQQLGI